MKQLDEREQKISDSGIYKETSSMRKKKEINHRKSKHFKNNSTFYQFKDIENNTEEINGKSTEAQKGSKKDSNEKKQNKQKDPFDFDFKSKSDVLKKKKSSIKLYKQNKTSIFEDIRKKRNLHNDPFKTSNETKKTNGSRKYHTKHMKNLSMVNFNRNNSINTTQKDLFKDLFEDLDSFKAKPVHKRNKSSILTPNYDDLLNLEFNNSKSKKVLKEENKYDFMDDMFTQNTNSNKKINPASPSNDYSNFI